MCTQMEGGIAQVSALDLDPQVAPLGALGESVPLLAQRFERSGALGLLLVDSPELRSLEQRHGGAARQRLLAALGQVVRSLGQERLDVDDLILGGEVGRNEILVFFFRVADSAAFYRTEMPGFAQALRRRLAETAARAFYPYLRRVPSVSLGSAVAIRNSNLAPETQLLRLVAEARDDAELARRVDEHGRRHRFTEVLLDRKIFSVYEPIVDVHTRTVFGYEALARGPESSGLYSPAALFSAAQEHDLVYELDCLCRASGLKGAIDFPSGTKLFLNVLPTSIHDPNFRAENLIRTLEACRLAPTDVVFEISEQESIENFTAFREMSDVYRSLGFQFALDDTGSGYAGFEELIELQPEFIKMDRSVVSGVDQDPARQEVLSALLGVAEKMGAKVIGEGLDRLEELETLAQLGIHFGQGWLFGHPTPLRSSGY